MDFVSFGNLTIATKWIILAAALLISYSLIRIFYKQKDKNIILEGISNSLMIGFVVIKLSLIIVSPKQVMNSPLSLLYFSGGEIGFWLGFIGAITSYYFLIKKKKLEFKNSMITYLYFLLYSFTLYHIFFFIIAPGLEHIIFVFVSMLFFVWHFKLNKKIKSLKNIIILVILIGMAAVAVNNHQAKQNQAIHPETDEVVATKGISKGDRAIDFVLKTADGEEVRLSDFNGQKVILNFWATWCPPCKAEMPHVEEFFEENKDKGITVLAVNLTTGEKNESDVKKFVKEYGLTFPVLMDRQGEVGNTYQAFTIPTSYFIDQNGIIQQKIVGPMSKETMKTIMDKMN